MVSFLPRLSFIITSTRFTNDLLCVMIHSEWSMGKFRPSKTAIGRCAQPCEYVMSGFMRILIDNASSMQVAEAMDLLRTAGIQPLAGGTVDDRGVSQAIVAVAENDHLRAIEILTSSKIAARTG